MNRLEVENIVASAREIEETPNLRGANLSEVDLSEVDLSGADLREADFSGANLRGANLSEADFSEADFSDADLRGANLRWANFSGANLRETDLRHACGQFSLFYGGRHHAWAVPGRVGIGCHVHNWEYWMIHYRQIGADNGYSVAEIDRYGDWIKSLDWLNNLDAPGEKE